MMLHVLMGAKRILVGTKKTVFIVIVPLICSLLSTLEYLGQWHTFRWITSNCLLKMGHPSSNISFLYNTFYKHKYLKWYKKQRNVFCDHIPLNTKNQSKKICWKIVQMPVFHYKSFLALYIFLKLTEHGCQNVSNFLKNFCYFVCF